jgi:hypothetical protein
VGWRIFWGNQLMNMDIVCQHVQHCSDSCRKAAGVFSVVGRNKKTATTEISKTQARMPTTATPCKVFYALEMLEGMCRVLLYMLEAVEGGFCLLEVL